MVDPFTIEKKRFQRTSRHCLSCLAYSGFYFAPATHASVLMPGTLPLFTTLVAAWVLRDHITPARAVACC